MRVYLAGFALTGGTPAHPWTVYVADAVLAGLEEAVAALGTVSRCGASSPA